jgi:hypothetical protein
MPFFSQMPGRRIIEKILIRSSCSMQERIIIFFIASHSFYRKINSKEETK